MAYIGAGSWRVLRISQSPPWMSEAETSKDVRGAALAVKTFLMSAMLRCCWRLWSFGELRMAGYGELLERTAGWIAARRLTEAAGRGCWTSEELRRTSCWSM